MASKNAKFVKTRGSIRIRMYDIDWIIPRFQLSQTSRLWQLASSISIASVGLFSKVLMEWLNSTTVYNRDILFNALERRPPHIPLITVSNHHSCLDDPGLWSCLKLKHLFNRDIMRWSMTAHDICFTNFFHSYFFMIGKCVPVIRGAGVYQEAVDFCIEKLNSGCWVHMFPEGRVNMTKEFMRLKWGVGRLIYESREVPMVIPMWHEGMDTVLPNEPPYYPRMGNKITVNFGSPIDFRDMVGDMKLKNTDGTIARKAITDRIQDEFSFLRQETQRLHSLALLS